MDGHTTTPVMAVCSWVILKRWAGSNPKVEIGTVILAILGPLQDLQVKPIYLECSPKYPVKGTLLLRRHPVAPINRTDEPRTTVQ